MMSSRGVAPDAAGTSHGYGLNGSLTAYGQSEKVGWALLWEGKEPVS